MRRYISNKFPTLFLIISILFLIMYVPNAVSGAVISEKAILSISHAGPVGGLGVPSVEGYILSLHVIGTTEFDLVVMTNESLSHYLNNNGSYDFVHALTRFNVTSVSVKGELPPGYYNAHVIAHAAGNFTYEWYYGPPNLMESPLVFFSILVISAFTIGMVAWYFVIRKRRSL